VGAAGVVSLGVGIGVGLAAKSKVNQSNGPDGGCNASTGVCTTQNGEDLRSSAVGMATAATVVFVVGAVAVAGGAVLYLTAPHDSPAASLAIAPSVMPGGGGALLRGTF
jgi:serine/threonine-protein kinase